MIYLKEDLTEEELKKAADLIVSTIPARKEAGEKLVFKALQGSDYLVAAFKNNDVVGVARAISDRIGWTLLTDVAVAESFRKKGIGRELITEVLEHYKGHEIFTYSYRDALTFYENTGFKRSKNAFTYLGYDEKSPENNLPEEEFFLPAGYRYETEFYPFAGNFPVGKKSSLDLSRREIRFSTEGYQGDWEALNLLLEKSFGEERDIKETKISFTESPVYAFAYDGDRPVACARAVSDGALQALILNVAVDPEYQGLHLGQKIVDLLSEQLKGQNRFLNTHPGGVGFYNRRPYGRNKTALLYPKDADMPEEIAKGFVLPKGFRFADEQRDE